MFRSWGADTVAMSVCEEVIAARHVGMRVLGISLVSNMGCGIEGGERPSPAARGARRGEDARSRLRAPGHGRDGAAVAKAQAFRFRCLPCAAQGGREVVRAAPPGAGKTGSGTMRAREGSHGTSAGAARAGKRQPRQCGRRRGRGDGRGRARGLRHLQARLLRALRRGRVRSGAACGRPRDARAHRPHEGPRRGDARPGEARRRADGVRRRRRARGQQARSPRSKGRATCATFARATRSRSPACRCTSSAPRTTRPSSCGFRFEADGGDVVGLHDRHGRRDGGGARGPARREAARAREQPRRADALGRPVSLSGQAPRGVRPGPSVQRAGGRRAEGAVCATRSSR